MTGKRLYECITDALHSERAMDRNYNDCKQSRNSFQFEQVVAIRQGEGEAAQEMLSMPIAPPAFGFLTDREKKAWNTAAKRLSGRRS